MAEKSPIVLRYVFDPLCGWCYAAGPALAGITQRDWITILEPWGLFAGAAAKQMTGELAHYIWSNDERIGRLTGLPFSDAYRKNILEAVDGRLDSTLSTRALTLIRDHSAEFELTFLHRLQQARYFEGRDLTDPRVLGEEASKFGGDALHLTERVVEDHDLAEATEKRIARGKALMHRVGASGVPILVVNNGLTERVLRGAALYRGPNILLAEIEAAISAE